MCFVFDLCLVECGIWWILALYTYENFLFWLTLFFISHFSISRFFFLVCLKHHITWILNFGYATRTNKKPIPNQDRKQIVLKIVFFFNFSGVSFRFRLSQTELLLIWDKNLLFTLDVFLFPSFYFFFFKYATTTVTFSTPKTYCGFEIKFPFLISTKNKNYSIVIGNLKTETVKEKKKETCRCTEC